jgi:eukaryotic-like serine/threonine-protein kinase
MPQRLGNYEPLIDLASGGMGTVHVARHVGAAGFERLVVLKRVHRHLLKDQEFRDMFIDEARVASGIRHPNVVPVIDVVEERGELFLVLEYVESLSIMTLCTAAREAKEPLPVPVVVRILSDVLSGLHAAHEATDMQGRSLELVHRDVSPQNVVIGVDGTSRLIDFGIAKAARRLTVTGGGVLKGKFGYMSPEQLKQLPVDRRADVFAAGVVLFEALTGRKPFPVDDDDALLALLLGDIPDPSSLTDDVPPKLDAVVQYALARDRDERFQTAAAFLQALETAVPPAPPREVARFVDRYGGEVLTRRREVLRRILELRAAGEARDDGTAAPVSTSTGNVTPTLVDGGTVGGTVVTPRTPLLPRPLLVGGALALVALAAVLIVARNAGSGSGTPQSALVSPGAPLPAAAPASAAPGAGAASSTPASAEPTATGAAASPPSSATPPAAPRTPRGTPDGARPKPKPSTELRSNPYGTP